MKIYKSKSNTYFNLVSRALAELKEKRLVEVINPEDRTGRIYRRTKEGEKVAGSALCRQLFSGTGRDHYADLQYAGFA